MKEERKTMTRTRPIITEEPIPNIKSLPDRMLELKATQNIIDAREEEDEYQARIDSEI